MKSAPSQQLEVLVRWLIRRDLPEVLAIEEASFEFAWTEEDFVKCLRQRNCIGMVAQDVNDQTLGFMVYELFARRLELMNFAVHPDVRRRGIGAAMSARLVEKLSAQKRTTLGVVVRERNLPAQLFFRAQGFRATQVLRAYYDDSPEDAYRMQYTLAAAAKWGSSRWAEDRLGGAV